MRAGARPASLPVLGGGERHAHTPRPRPLTVPRAVRTTRDAYVRLCLRVLGRPAKAAANANGKLRHALEQAHMDYLPETYVAVTWMNALVAVLASYLVMGAAAAAAVALQRPPTLPMAIVLLLAPLFVGSGVWVAQAVWPDYRAGERRRRIDRDLPYAVNYIAAMASAGVVPAALLRDLARERTYGEVSREVAWIVRDLDLLGVDLLTALHRATGRTPSRRFEEFLQGAKTTILSGGDLKSYFRLKADQYMSENRRVQREFLDSLGLLAESYVTVVIAGPLFMLVMLSIMLLIGRANIAAEGFLFVLVFMMLPAAHLTFSWVIANMSPEA